MEAAVPYEQSDLLAQVYRQRAKHLDDINHVSPWHVLYRRKTLKVICSLLPPDARVLDVASGTGIFARQILSRVKSITVLDCLPEMLELSREAILNSENNKYIEKVRFVQHNIIQDKEVFFGKHDLIIMTQALNFISDIGKLFNFMAAHLSERGIVYFDVDTMFRWAVIEAFSGHLDNALEIGSNKRDAARMIVGAEYYFYTRAEIEKALAEAGLHLNIIRGICYVSPFAHIFNASADFLRPDLLDSRVVGLLDSAELSKLERLDILFESNLSPEAGGWMTFQAGRKGQ